MIQAILVKSLVQKFIAFYKFRPEVSLGIKTKYSLMCIYHRSQKIADIKTKIKQPIWSSIPRNSTFFRSKECHGRERVTYIK